MGSSLLYWECTRQKPDLAKIRRYLDNGADPDTTDAEGVTPLIICARWGHVDALKLLIEYKPDLNKADIYGNTPLVSAAHFEQAVVVHLLLEAGADPNIADHQHDTPLIIAAYKGIDDMVQSLLRHGANIDARDARGFNAEEVATTQRKFDTADIIETHRKREERRVIAEQKHARQNADSIRRGLPVDRPVMPISRISIRRRPKDPGA